MKSRLGDPEEFPVGKGERKKLTEEQHLVAHPTARKWVITPIINGISRVNPLITGVITVITHLLSGMSHQVVNVYMTNWKITVLSING